MTASEPIWQFHRFDTLNTQSLFDLLKLRIDVFVVEQACAYPELDAHDKADDTLHLLGLIDNELIAYARAMPPEFAHLHSGKLSNIDKRPAVRIGRVVVAKEHRGHGIAQSLMQHLIEHIQSMHPQLDQVLAAQTTVQSFYAALGFTPTSEPYMEDGIEHIDMHRRYAPLTIHC